MSFAVVIHEKGGQPRRQDFDKNEVTIGRVQGNDIVLPKQNVSKKHSRIVVKDGKFIIVDLKSTNGTYVNGRKIASPMVIKETDKIYIGDFILSTEGTGAVSTPVPDSKVEPEMPKIEPPRKAPVPPAPAKVVPTPPAPITTPKKAVAPSGAATAVSYDTAVAAPLGATAFFGVVIGAGGVGTTFAGAGGTGALRGGSILGISGSTLESGTGVDTAPVPSVERIKSPM